MSEDRISKIINDYFDVVEVVILLCTKFGHKVDFSELREECNMKKYRQHLCVDNFFGKFG